jgi:hypothetical protein
MTVASTSSRTVLLGNGATTVFPFAFKCLLAADLVVLFTDALGNVTTLTSGQYTDANSYPTDDSGGSITYNPNGTPIPAGTTLTIYRNETATQPYAISNQGAFWPQVIEKALDRIILLIQQFIDGLGRTLKISPTDGAALNPLPAAALRANSFLAFDASGQPITATSVGTTPVSTFWSPILQVATAVLARTGLGAAGLADNNAFTGTNTFPTQAAADNSTKAATTAYADRAASGATAQVVAGGVRQTVAAGPVTTAGLPNFLPSTNAALSITSQNVSGTAPLVATAANGWSATTGLPIDAIGYAIANLTWSGLTASRVAATPNVLYGTIANGIITPASTILAPIYQWGGTPSTVNGQITFNISEMKAYLGNGTTAPQTNLVVFGEAATDATTVTATVAYAYNGRYESGYTATLPAAGVRTSANHNIGVTPRIREIIFECTTADNGYAVGEQFTNDTVLCNNGSDNRPVPVVATAKTMSFTAGANINFTANNPTNGTLANPNAGSYKFKQVANRGW